MSDDFNYNIAPPPGAKPVGFRGDLAIYEEAVPVFERQVHTVGGEVQYHVNPASGVRLKERTVLVQTGTRTRRFVLATLPNNQVEKNYDFEPTEAEIRTAEALAATAPERLVERLAAAEEQNARLAGQLAAVMDAAGIKPGDLAGVGG
jgi:hypothetical protein